MSEIFKIGFACKFHSDTKTDADFFNFNTTTARFLNTLSDTEKVSKLHNLALGNIEKLERLLLYVNTLNEPLKMMRIGSDLFPMYTHAVSSEAYADYDFKIEVERKLGYLGEFARLHKIRLSMHPGQFTVLGSMNENTVQASIRELEYHTDIFRTMGYAGWHPDGLAINIHGGSGKVPLSIFINHVKRCSDDCRNWLTVENDEFSFDIKSLCTISDHIAIVPDLHHEWIRNGHYLDVTDRVFKIVLDSWRGIRPKLHCAMSREDLFDTHTESLHKPVLHECLAKGRTKSALRAHSDSSWNNALVEYYATFLPAFDIMCEMKWKQVGAAEFYNKLCQFKRP